MALYVDMSAMLSSLDENVDIMVKGEAINDYGIVERITQTNRVSATVYENNTTGIDDSSDLTLYVSQKYSTYKYLGCRFENRGNTYRIVEEKYRGSKMTSHFILYSVMERGVDSSGRL